MYRGTQAMKEIHCIQEKIYEDTKNMNAQEEIDYIHKNALEVEKKYGFKLKKAAHSHR
jgi:hypothetical protein